MTTDEQWIKNCHDRQEDYREVDKALVSLFKKIPKELFGIIYCLYPIRPDVIIDMDKMSDEELATAISELLIMGGKEA